MKDEDKNKFMAIEGGRKPETPAENTQGDIAKDIRARIADLNELLETAYRMEIYVDLTVLEPDDDLDDDQFETLSCRISVPV